MRGGRELFVFRFQLGDADRVIEPGTERARAARPSAKAGPDLLYSLGQRWV